MHLAAGQTILNRKYQILELIGEGEFVRVWKAREPDMEDRLVAIKELKRDLLSPQDLVEHETRLRREVELGVMLSDANVSNVVRAIALERPDETKAPLLVLEYMPSGSLGHLLAQHPQGMPVEQAVQITLQLCRALEGFHSLPVGPVHRNIKPSNVLLAADSEARLADFGLAQLPGATGRSMGSGGLHPGTPFYMAPEQETSRRSLTPSADLYAVGCMLFEMLTGKRYKRVRPGTRARALRPDAPPWLDALLTKALAEDQWERYQDAAEMGSALREGPERADHHFERGKSYHQEGDYGRAIADYGRAIELDPARADYHSQRGRSYLWKGDYDRAVAGSAPG